MWEPLDQPFKDARQVLHDHREKVGLDPQPVTRGRPGGHRGDASPSLTLGPDSDEIGSDIGSRNSWLLVARQLSKAEVKTNPKAQEAVATEWSRLKALQCWDPGSVREMQEVKNRAQLDGQKVHFGRLFALCHEKHSEDPKLRKHKGRVVFGGHAVTDEFNGAAIFQELQSSTALFSQAKLLDFIGCLDNHEVQIADAVQAYVQALLASDIPTWIILPEDQWEPGWRGRFRQPVVRLRLALYGHPLSGYYWEKHCKQCLGKVGFRPVEGQECLFFHKELSLTLLVYVDDFKLAGPKKNLEKGWAAIRREVNMEPPTDLSRYLGCVHTKVNVPANLAKDALLWSGPYLETLQGSLNAQVRGAARPSGKDNSYVGVEDDMADFVRQCVEK